METTRITLIILLAMLTFSCNKPVDLAHERALLLASNERQREAHMNSDPSLLALGMADTVKTVQRGEIRVEAKAGMMKRWEAYFKTIEYSKWDDLQEPLIEISDDATLAWVSVKKITVSTLVDDLSQTIDTTYFAWTTGYRKIGGDWKVYSVTSTRVAK